MKIGLVLPAVPTYSETFFRSKIRGLQAGGHEVLLFVNSGNTSDAALGCEIRNAPKLQGSIVLVIFTTMSALLKAFIGYPKKSSRLFAFNKMDGLSFWGNLKNIAINQFLFSKDMDWLHFGFGTMALGREHVAEAIGAKMAVSFRGFDYYAYPQKHANCYDSLFGKTVSYHVLSLAMKQGLEQQGIPAKAITVIPPAIDTSVFDGSHLRPTYGRLQITTVARLHPIKGIPYILEAMVFLLQRGVSFRYTVIGDGEEHINLVHMVKALGLEAHVDFTGKLSSEAVKEYLKQTDIYVQYSLEEGFCNAVLEAQAMGLLCVVSDAEGLAENVLHERTGWVVPKNSPVLLAQKLQEVVSLPPEVKQKVSEEAMARVRRDFDLQGQIGKFLKFYEADSL